jgi:hypothetical protein
MDSRGSSSLMAAKQEQGWVVEWVTVDYEQAVVRFRRPLEALCAGLVPTSITLRYWVSD